MARVLLVILIVLAAGGTASARVLDRPVSARPGLAEWSKEAPGAIQINSVGELEQDVISLINRQRSSHGLAPLRVNPQLAAAARIHSMSMARRGFFSHQSPGGAAFGRRMRTYYPALGGRSWAVGENLMWASPDISARETVTMWLKSPGHRRNLLGPRWRDVGISAVHALAAPGVYEGLDVTIVTADFGVR
jgi:uncharacterized protein YkwD